MQQELARLETMPAPICVECQVEMRCKENDKLVNDVTSGCFPSTCWLGDMFECPVCFSEIVLGFGAEIGVEQLDHLRSVGLIHKPSMTFAREPRQLQEYADQFKKQIDQEEA